MPAHRNQSLSPHILTGSAGEDHAARYLAAKGFSPAARNWRPHGAPHRLELDLVGIWEKTLVFVEVKSCRETAPGAGENAALHNFSPAKRRNMVRAAYAFLAERDAWDMPCRFDLVCVTFIPGLEPRVEHYRNVIELGNTLAGGDASWQPW